MLALWMPEDADRSAVESAPGEWEVRSVEAWGGFRRLFPEARCAGVVAPDPDPELFARLQALKDRHPGIPVVLATRRHPATLRRLKDLTVEEVVWMDEMETQLWPAVRRADAERWFARLADRISADPGLPTTLAAALERALRRRPPFASVQALAGEIERDRRTLWHHWRNVVGEDRNLTVKAFLDWVLMLRAAATKTGDRSWRRVAAELGVPGRTLRRVARRRCEEPLQRLADRGRETVFAAFEDEVVEPLLAGPGEAGGA